MHAEDLELFNTIARALFQAEQQEPVIRPIPAEALNHQLDLELPDLPGSSEQYAQALRQLVLSTPRTATRGFFNQLFGGRQSKAVMGDLLAVLLNNSMYTYKVAGPMVGVEKALLRKICDLIGYGAAAGGTFAPGGSMSNYMAMLMARDRQAPHVRQQGSHPNLMLYTSADSHYSIPKNAALMGIGREQVRLVPTNERGEMIPEALAEQIQADLHFGKQPFFVNATAGTTVMGAFDPIPPLAAICKTHGLWLHVDGAYCGGVVFSKSYRHLAEGLELSDSFSVNAHKMLGTPLSCSVIVTQDKKHLYDSFANEADYLYQTDEDDFNLGKTSLQCGRRNDALKLWTLWKAIGSSGIEQLVDQQFLLAAVARRYVSNHPDYSLHSFEDSISVCFNYREIPADLLCTRLYEEGRLMVGHGSFKGRSFVRLVTINAGNTEQEILDFFAELEAFVAEGLVAV